MGLVKRSIILRNAAHAGVAEIEVEALAASGVIHLCIPEHVRTALRLAPVGSRAAMLADGRRVLVPYVGPLEIRLGPRIGYAGALVMGDEVLIGAIPMEDLDLVIVPGTRTLDFNPDSPDVASTIAKEREAREYSILCSRQG